MFFALGFLVMGLLGLLFLPFYWRRAVRLSTQRLEAQMPLSMAEVMAGRDGLRAEFAMQTRRIEQRAEAALAARADDLAELGRRAGQVSALADDLSTSRTRAGEFEANLSAALRAKAEAEAALGAGMVEIHDANSFATRVQGEYRDLMRRHQDLQQQTDSQRATIAALSTRASSLEIRLEDTREALETEAAAKLAEIQAGAVLELELKDTRARLAESARLHASLREQHLAAGEEAAAMLARLATESARLAQARADHSGETARAEKAGTALAEALRREKDLRASLQRQMDMARAADANLARRIDTLRAENEALRKQAEQLEAQAATRANVAGDGSGSEDIALLRAAISDIGREMIRLHRVVGQDSDNAQPAAGKLRVVQARSQLDA